MRILEYILIVISLLGLLFKVLHWPFGSVLLIIGLGSLSAFYFALGWAHFNKIRLRNLFKKESYSEINGMQIAGKFLFSWGLSTLSIGILFKQMIWPGGKIQLIAGLVMVVLGLIIAAIFYFLKKHPHNIGLFYRGLIFCTLGIISLSYVLPAGGLIDPEIADNPNYIKAIEAYQEDHTEENFHRIEYEMMRAYGDTLSAEYYYDQYISE